MKNSFCEFQHYIVLLQEIREKCRVTPSGAKVLDFAFGHKKLTSEVNSPTSVNKKLPSEVNFLPSEHKKLSSGVNSLTSEHRKLPSEVSSLPSEYKKLASKVQTLTSEAQPPTSEVRLITSEAQLFTSEVRQNFVSGYVASKSASLSPPRVTHQSEKNLSGRSKTTVRFLEV